MGKKSFSQIKGQGSSLWDRRPAQPFSSYEARGSLLTHKATTELAAHVPFTASAAAYFSGGSPMAANGVQGGGLGWQGMLPSLGGVAPVGKLDPARELPSWPVEDKDPIWGYMHAFSGSLDAQQLLLVGPRCVSKLGGERWHSPRSWIFDRAWEHRDDPAAWMVVCGERVSWWLASLTGTSRQTGLHSEAQRGVTFDELRAGASPMHGAWEFRTASLDPPRYRPLSLAGSALGGTGDTFVVSAAPRGVMTNHYFRGRSSAMDEGMVIALFEQQPFLSSSAVTHGVAGMFDARSGGADFWFSSAAGNDHGQLAIATNRHTTRALYTIAGDSPEGIDADNSSSERGAQLAMITYKRYGAISGSTSPLVTFVANEASRATRHATTTVVSNAPLANPPNGNSVISHGGVHRLDQTLAAQGLEGALDFSLTSNRAARKEQLLDFYDRVMYQQVWPDIGAIRGRSSALRYGEASGSRAVLTNKDQRVPAFTGLGWKSISGSSDTLMFTHSSGALIPKRGIALGWAPTGSAFTWHCWVNRASYANWETASNNRPNLWPLLGGGEGTIASATASAGPMNFALGLMGNPLANPNIRARSWVRLGTGADEEVNWTTKLSGSALVPSDIWTHIAVVHQLEGSQLTLDVYVDGGHLEGATHTLAAAGLHLTGSEMVWGGGFDWGAAATVSTVTSWRGHLAASAYHTKALSAFEISSIYLAGTVAFQGG